MTCDPFALFSSWCDEARASEPNDANAMALATASRGGAPSVRMVLLKGHGPDGFIFYTNSESRKGEQLAENPQVALLFHWKSLRRQIRIEGLIAPVEAQPRQPARRLGQRSIAPAGEPGPFRGALRRCRGGVRGLRCPAAAALDRLARDPREDRILAGPRAPAPRAHAFRPGWRGLVAGPSLPLIPGRSSA